MIIGAYMDLDRLFTPRSIAVIGASATPGSVGNIYLKSLLDGEYGGRVYPVNPKYDEILGLRCYDSIRETGPADLAVIATNRRLALRLLEECAAAGVENAIIPTGGFEEVGEEGARLEEEIGRVAQGNGIALLGTNTLGLINNHIGLQINFNPRRLPPVGGVSIISQSGGMGLSIIAKLREEGVGMSKWVGVGNRTLLDFPDLLEYMKNDDSTRAIGLFMEGTERARELCELARELVTEKPVVVYKMGKSEAVDFMAVTHTGTGVGKSEVYEGAFRQHGMITADSTRALVAKLKALSMASSGGKNLGMFTYTAGPTIAASDILVDHLDLPSPDGKTIEDIRSIMRGEPPAVIKNPLDVNGEGYSSQKYEDLLMAFGRDEAYDILATISTAGLLFPSRELLKVKGELKKPVVHCHIADSIEIDSEEREELQAEGIPVFSTAEEMATGLVALSEYQDIKDRLVARERGGTSIRLDASHIEADILTEHEVKELLKERGFPVVTEEKVSCREELIRASEHIGFPAVLKVLSRDIVHKSELGAVCTSITDAQNLLNRWREMKEKWPQEDFLLQRMISGGVEVIVGRKKDPLFGDLISVGVGGYLADLFPPVVGVCPCTKQNCVNMIDRLTPQKILDGYRGQSPVDREALASLMARVSRIELKEGALLEMDLNPVIAKGSDLYIVDALLRKEVKEG